MIAELYTKDGSPHITYDNQGHPHLSNKVQFAHALVEGETVVVYGPYHIPETFTVLVVDSDEAILVSQET